MARLIRAVVENLSVAESVDAEQEIYPRLGDAFDALKWWLARVPDSGEIIDVCGKLKFVINHKSNHGWNRWSATRSWA